MPFPPKFSGAIRLRLATVVFPPLGVFLLWRGPYKLWRKLLGTLGVLLFSLLYSAGIIFLLTPSPGLVVKWRGAYFPRPTPKKPPLNYAPLERARPKPAGVPPPSGAQPPTTKNAPRKPKGPPARDAPGPVFRGPRR